MGWQDRDYARPGGGPPHAERIETAANAVRMPVFGRSRISMSYDVPWFDSWLARRGLETGGSGRSMLDQSATRTGQERLER